MNDGTALVAHEVGFGKTATMIASAMERKRMGIIQKPMFVVPKSTHSQFQDQFQELYPGARILAPEEGEFSEGNRQRFIGRIATGQWDGVILTTEQFSAIPLSPEQEKEWIEKEIRDLEESLYTLEQDDSQDRTGDTRSAAQKYVEDTITSHRNRLRELVELRRKDENAEYFDNLGVDALYVDEADRYKNLPYRTGMGGRGDNIKGLPNSKSKRAWDMYMKIRYLQKQGGEAPAGTFAKTGVVFATGTPVSNTLAETWTMMRYLQEAELRKRGVHHFDAWAKTFGEVTEDMEQSVTGEYKTTKRFANFHNLPELAGLFQNVADIRVIDETPDMQAIRPHLAGGKRQIITSPASDDLRAYTADLQERAHNLEYPPPLGGDNMLKISSDARKASLDMRMVDGNAEPNPDGKLVMVARNVARIHAMEAPVKGVQLVFLDIGTPKGAEESQTDEQIEASAEKGEQLTEDEQLSLIHI